MDDGNSVTTRLLTLLNVSAVKTGKRKRTFDDPLPVKKLNKRKSVLFTNVSNDEQQPAPNPTERAEDADALEQVEEIEQKEQAEDNESHGTSDHLLCTCSERNVEAILESYEVHFGPTPAVLTQDSREAVNRSSWILSKDRFGKLGSVVTSSPEGARLNITVNIGQKIPVRLTFVYLYRKEEKTYSVLDP